MTQMTVTMTEATTTMTTKVVIVTNGTSSGIAVMIAVMVMVNLANIADAFIYALYLNKRKFSTEPFLLQGEQYNVTLSNHLSSCNKNNKYKIILHEISLMSAVMIFPDSTKLLLHNDISIADTGSSTHSSESI